MKYVTLMLVGLFLLVLSVGAYAYLAHDIRGFVSRISAVQEGVETIGRREALAKSLGTFIAETERDRAALENFVVGDGDVAHAIETIETLAREEKVVLSISSVAVGGSEWKNHEPVRVSFSARGTFAALGAFATALESLPFGALLRDVSFEVDGAGWLGSFGLVFIKEKTL